MINNTHEKINVCVVEPSDIDWIKEQHYKIGEIAWVISFWDNSKFESIIKSGIPSIYSHGWYRNDEWRYVESTEQWPLQLFLIEWAESLHIWLFEGINFCESKDFIIWSIVIDETDPLNGDNLIEISKRAYDSINILMKKTWKNTLVRVGNYITDILEDTVIHIDWEPVKTNRYKAFCTGRWLSLENTFWIKDSSQLPTATGIWNHFAKRWIKIFFIASNRTDVQNHKNPQQINPADYNVEQHGIKQKWSLSVPKFSRATTLANDNMLFVGWTASILWQDVVHEGNIVKQTQQSLQNIVYTMEEAESRTGIDYRKMPVVLKVFVKDKNDFDAVKMVIESKSNNPLPNTIIETVYTHWDVCRDQWLVEISCETMNPIIAWLILERKLAKNQSMNMKIIRKMIELWYWSD